MGSPVDSNEIVMATLLVKAVLAMLAAMVFAYYKMNWERAKRHMPLHFFYAKWKTVRHAVTLGFCAVGFAVGFAIELIGVEYGMRANLARVLSGIFEIAALLGMLYVFFTLALEDVPSFQHIADAAKRHHTRPNQQVAVQNAKGAEMAGMARKKKNAKKGARTGKRKGKR